VEDGAHAADLRGENKPGAQEWHGHSSEIQIKLDASADEERAGQELAKLSTPNGEIDRRSTPDDCRRNKRHEDHVARLISHSVNERVPKAHHH